MPNTARDIVVPFYEALDRPATRDVRALIERAVSPAWRSFAGEGASKGREEFVQQVIGFGKAIPDLAWKVDEVIAAGDRVVVRSTASGTPAGDFMGVPHAGRRFSIMAIDLHTVADGQLVTAYHVEDWATALRQLRG